MNDFIDSLISNRVCLAIGQKGSGKSYTLLNFLRHCFINKLFEQYILILPSYSCEADDSYKFINYKDKNIYIFESYDSYISEQFLQSQSKQKKHTLFVIDDASSQNIWNIDNALKHIITILRHLDTCLYIIAHAASNILSPFLRMNVDVLLLSKITNHKLLETIHEEYLSLTKEYFRIEGKRKFIQDYIELNKNPYQIIYLDLRKNIIDFECGNWKFSNNLKSKININGIRTK